MDDAAAVASEKRRREEPPAAGAKAMDDVAAASSSQKRRRDEPESEEPPARRDGGSGEDAGLDLISELPVELRGVILSRLPSTKGAARTAILSFRWRHIWRSTPLDLAVDDDLARQERNRITAVSEILAAHRGPVRRLSLETIRLGRDRYARFDGWFRPPVLDGLEELQFYGNGNPPRLPPLRPLPLPPSALRFAPRLRAASIGGCDLPQINAVFPVLKRLKLYDVCVSEEALRRLLAGCIVLEALELSRIHGFSSVQIVSPTLRSISVSVVRPFMGSYYLEAQPALQELVIEDAPCLERLITLGPLGPSQIKINAAPKLTVLGYLFGNIIKCSVPGIFATKSCLMNVRQNGTPIDPIDCLDLHLREIVLNGYQGRKREVNFAKFFVLHARVLKVMKFGVSGNCDEKWMANQREQLHLDNRASTDAQFYFERDRVESSFYDNKHIHDMWTPDPFDSSFCKCC